MRISTKFSVAVHALLLIAVETSPCSSAWIAGSVNTNPVVIRRIIGQLQQAGLVSGNQGRTGYTLLLQPSEIRLLDIYKAVAHTESDQLFAIHEDTNIQCMVGATIQLLLESVMAEAQQALELVLAGVNLEQLIQKMKQAQMS